MNSYMIYVMVYMMYFVADEDLRGQDVLLTSPFVIATWRAQYTCTVITSHAFWSNSWSLCPTVGIAITLNWYKQSKILWYIIGGGGGFIGLEFKKKY